MSDNKKKGRRRAAGAPKPEPETKESGKPETFEATVPVKEPEITPEKAVPVAKPQPAKTEEKKSSRKKLLNLIENAVLVFGFAIMLGSIFFVNEFRPIVAGAVDIVVAPIIATMPFYIVVLIIAASALFSWFLTKNGVPQAISTFLLSISNSQWFILFAVNLIFFIGGMFLEGIALIIMFVPILLPVALQVGINPVFFGVMVVINIAIGTLTPPVGVCLFVASSSGNESFEAVTHRAMPFVGALAAVLILCCLFPEVVTYLPAKVFP
jgi:TRAP-type C4-dicarboxylate transport system permease large subunit